MIPAFLAAEIVRMVDGGGRGRIFSLPGPVIQKLTLEHVLKNYNIALWSSASKFTVCDRDEVGASNCEF